MHAGLLDGWTSTYGPDSAPLGLHILCVAARIRADCRFGFGWRFHTR